MAKSLEGVYVDGYGIVPRAVVFDSTLSPEAKLIYAYLCACKGGRGGFQKFPAEKKILSDLCIEHRRYLSRRSELIEKGYIEVRKTHIQNGGSSFCNYAEFTIVLSNKEATLSESAVLHEGVFADGFGLVPRMVLHDPDLSICAKAMYVFLSVQVSASTSCDRYLDIVPSSATALLMPEKRARKYMREIIDSGYVRMDKIKNSAAKRFVLVFEPPTKKSSSVTGQNSTSGNGQNDTSVNVQNDTSDNGQNDITETAQNDTFGFGQNDTSESIQNDTSINNRASRNNENILFSSTYNPSFHKSQDRKSDRLMDGRGVGDREINVGFDGYIEMIRKQIEADILEDAYGKNIVSTIVGCIDSVYNAPAGDLTQINGTRVAYASMQYKFRMLDMHMVENVILRFRDVVAADRDVRVTNVTAYLRAMLYNADSLSVAADMYCQGIANS